MNRTGKALRLALILLIAGAVTACGGGGGEDSASPNAVPGGTSSPATGNTAPTIQGQPPSSVTAGQSYDFLPTASDSNGDSLTFTANNMPTWATFNASTGRISGSPTAANVGTYSNISISVSDGTGSSTLGPFSIAVTQSGSGNAVVSWEPPTMNSDGTVLQDLIGYRVIYGKSEGDLTQSVSITNPSLSTYVVENLSSGTWYFAVVAINSVGIDSSPSGLASKTVM